jgi:GT2 family glycosyltransferase
LLLNNDTYVDPDWVTEIVCVLEANPQVGAAQAKIKFIQSPNNFNTAGTYIDRFGFAMARGLDEEDRGQYDRLSEVFSASGAAFALRHTALKIG